jgi:phage virion morphogenesis protein
MAISRAVGGDLRSLRDRLASMMTPAFQTEVAQLCANAALKKVADEFNRSQDPYDHPWAPRAHGKGKLLRDTGRLAASFAVEPYAGFFRIGTAVGYAHFHQFGTRPRHVASRAARQNARGRFVSRRARTSYLLRIRAHENRGIPARPMLPQREIPDSWRTAFAKEINRAVAGAVRGQA